MEPQELKDHLALEEPVQPVGEGQEFPAFEPSDVFDGDPEAAAVRAVAKGSKDAKDLADATAWFMSDAPAPPVTRTFGLNVGRYDEAGGVWEDFFVDWTVTAISREKIREIQRMSVPARQRSGGTMDATRANLGIAAEGTTTPDIASIAAQLGTQDLAEVLRRRLAHKAGLIDQIAGEVLTVSGYDDADLRDPKTVLG